MDFVLERVYIIHDKDDLPTNVCTGRETIPFSQFTAHALEEACEFVSDCNSYNEVKEKILKSDKENLFRYDGEARVYLGSSLVGYNDKNKSVYWDVSL